MWLKHGPDRAAELLGVVPHQNPESRRLGGHEAAKSGSAWGSCAYTSSFAGDQCFEFRGDTWTDDSAKSRCDNAMQGTTGTLKKGAVCPEPDGFAGFCMTKIHTEASVMALSSMAST